MSFEIIKYLYCDGDKEFHGCETNGTPFDVSPPLNESVKEQRIRAKKDGWIRTRSKYSGEIRDFCEGCSKFHRKVSTK